MSGIVLSSATRQSLISAQDTAALMATTQNRLSTGKKVNSALDNPTNFFTASGLDNRAGDLSNLLDAISNGIQTVQAASTAITSIQKLVDSAKSTANQALSDKSTQTSAAVATAATLTAGTSMRGGTAAADGTQDFSTTGDASFTITSGGKSVDVKLNKDSLTGVAKDLTKVTSDEILTAINNQISNSGAAGLKGAVAASLTTDGRLTLTTTATGSTAGVSVAADAGTTKNIGFGVGGAAGGAGTPATAAKLTGTAPLTGAALDFTSTSAVFKVSDGTNEKTITLDQSYADADAVAAAIQTQIGTGAGSPALTATADATGHLVIASTATGVGATAKVTYTSGGDVGFGTSATPVVQNGTDAVSGAGVAGTSYSASGTAASAGSAATNTNRSDLAKQFNDLLTQINQLAQDASYNGVNLLNKKDDGSPTGNKLHIAFNEKDTAGIDLHGQDATSTGLGLTSATLDFQSDTEINDRLTQLTSATNSLRSMSSTLGSNLTVVQTRQDFTKNLINVLQTGSSALTDADLNEEAANSQALSTRQSLAISALSLANTSQQGVLQLLR